MTKQRQEAPELQPGLRSAKWIRFAVWVFAVTGALAFHTHLVISMACLLVIAGLLGTTPAGAIRLPRWISEIFILSSTLAIDHGRAAKPLVMHIGILLVMLVLLRLWGKSPWWAVLYGWFPIYGT